MKRVPVEVKLPRLLRQRIALPEVCIPTAIPYRIFGKLRLVPIDYSNYFEALRPKFFNMELFQSTSKSQSVLRLHFINSI